MLWDRETRDRGDADLLSLSGVERPGKRVGVRAQHKRGRGDNEEKRAGRESLKNIFASSYWRGEKILKRGEV